MSTYADIGIRLNGQEFQVSGLVEFELVKTVNDHAWLTLSGKLPAESRPHYAEMALEEVKVEFDVNKANLFRGLAIDFDLFYEAGQDRFFLRAASHTYEMDRNVAARSFQNAQMPVADLTKQLTSYYPKDECIIDSVLPAQAVLGKFTLQFRETDFAFLRRIASRFYTGLVPDATSLHPKLTLGMPAGEDRGSLGERESQAMVSRNISEYKEFVGNIPKEQTESVREEDFTRYELFTPKLFNIGDKLTVGKVKLLVCAARSYLDKGIIRFTCVAAPEKAFRLRQLFNRQITGASLSGTVLAVGADTEQKDLVKVGLGIDGEQKAEEATWFPYATPYAAEENTGWYLMPETGDEIRLTFPTEFEEDAVVTCAIRNKGTDAVNKPDQKYFRTKYGKRMIFEPDRFLFVGKNDRLGMTMGGKNHIKFTSPEAKFVIKAVGNINLTAENVVNLSTQNAITCAIGAGDDKQTKLKLDVGKTKGTIAFLGKVSEEDGKKVADVVNPEVTDESENVGQCKYCNAEIGILSKKHESNGKPGIVSSGVGDSGGASFGAYQFASVYNVPYNFVIWMKGKNDNIYNQLNDAYLKDGSKYGGNFKQTWGIIGKENPSEFLKLQHDYVKLQYYDKVVSQIKSEIGFDFDSQCYVLKNALWSRAVQHGTAKTGAKAVILAAFENLDLCKASTEEIVKAIYEESGRVSSTGKKKICEENIANPKVKADIVSKAKKYGIYNKYLKYYSRNSAEVQVGVWERLNIYEKNDAIKMICQNCPEIKSK